MLISKDERLTFFKVCLDFGEHHSEYLGILQIPSAVTGRCLTIKFDESGCVSSMKIFNWVEQGSLNGTHFGGIKPAAILW